MKKLGWEGARIEFKKQHGWSTIFLGAWVLLSAILLKSMFALIFGGALVALLTIVNFSVLAVMLRCSCNKLVKQRYNYCPWCAREVPQELKTKR